MNIRCETVVKTNAEGYSYAQARWLATPKLSLVVAGVGTNLKHLEYFFDVVVCEYVAHMIPRWDKHTHTHTESDLKCVIFHISMDIIKWKKNGIWPQACLTSTLSLSHSLYHFPYLAYAVHMWIFVYRMLVWWPETISFCFASFNVSSNSGCFFSYVFFSPSNSDIHSLFFFSCVYTVILASQRTCTRPKRICWSNGVECVAVQYFDVISIWIWNIDSYEHWAITRTTFFISRWCITVLLTEYLLTIFSSFF